MKDEMESILGKKRKRSNSGLNQNSKLIEIHTINELHENALKLFNEKKYEDFETLEKNIISIYDLDENINFEYLKLLNNYYVKNKVTIDQDEKGLSDKIAKNFYTYIFTLKYEDRLEIYNTYKYFGQNEIFEKDEKYFYKRKMKYIFHELINELIKLESIDRPYNQYNNIIINYSIPETKNKNLIPAIFGNEEFRYTTYITLLGSIINISKISASNEGAKNDLIRQYIRSIVLFKDYLVRAPDKYDEEYIRYILFCLITVFFYSKTLDTLKETISNNLYKCSIFLYESISKKKAKLELIKDYIKNKNFDLDKINENTILEIFFDDKTYSCKISDHYFDDCMDKWEIIDTICRKLRRTFAYYQKNNRILDDISLENKYDEYFNKILASEINKKYIKQLKSMERYEYAFDKKKFINEINIKYAMLPINELSGITIKNFYTVYINNRLDNFQVEKMLPQLGAKLIVKLKEILNHIYRVIMHVNNIRFPLDTPKKIFKNKKMNNKFNLKSLSDRRDKYETALFGNKLDEFFFSCIFFIFDEDNWHNKNIDNFSKAFRKKNVFQKSVKILQENLDKLSKKNDFIQSFQDKYRINLKQIESNWLKDDQTINPGIAMFTEDYQCIRIGKCGTHLLRGLI